MSRAERIARMVVSSDAIENAYYFISDIVDLWENKHREQALKNVCIYYTSIKDLVDNYRNVKTWCGDYNFFDRKVLPLLARSILKEALRNDNFKNGLERWNNEYGKCFINDLLK